MASLPGGMTGPFWSAEARQHYWYDEHNDLIVFQDNRRMPRPESIPRAMLMPPSLSYTYPGSPQDNRSAAYTTRVLPANQQVTEPIGGRTNRSNVDAVGITSAVRAMTLQDGSNTESRSSQNQRAAGPSQPPSQQPGSSVPRGQQVGSQQVQQPGSTVVNNDDVTTRLTDVPEGKLVEVFNNANLVATSYRTGPRKEITDPNLFQSGKGRSAYRMLINTGSEGDTEKLFSTFKIQQYPKKFFVQGKVFMVLWSEPAGEKTLVTAGITTQRAPGTTQGRYGETVYSKVRRFVVIREANVYCSALPIATYGTEGVGKPNINKSEHAIIYTGRTAPEPMPKEIPIRGEQGMRPGAIRVEPDDKVDKLDPRSRLDFGKVHTIQHNIKVRSYGQVSKGSMQALLQQFNNCWHAPSVPMVIAAPAPAPIAGPSRPPAEGRTPGANRRGSVSGENWSRSGPESGSGGSQHARKIDHRSQPATATENNSRSDSRAQHDPRTLLARRQEQERQRYWAAVDQYQRDTGCTREEAVTAVHAHYARIRAQHARNNEDEIEDDDEDEDEDEDQD